MDIPRIFNITESAHRIHNPFDSAFDSPTDPGGTETGRYTDLFVRDGSCSVAVDKLDPIGDAEFFSARSGLPGGKLAHVDARAADSMIARPGAQHLARTAAEVKDAGPWVLGPFEGRVSEFDLAFAPVGAR